jgi:flagellar motor switch protein FliN/FliY
MTIDTADMTDPAPDAAASASSRTAAAEPVHPLSTRRSDVLDNVPLGVEVVLGRTTKLFRELRELEVGTAIELDRSPHQPVDVLVNGAPFAKGEIVVINGESLGVRITEILQTGTNSL